jgi:Ser/Thr protein kinase RdoA (MazF antagonist)
MAERSVHEGFMEKEIRDRFNEGVLGEAMERFGIAEGDIKLLDGFESFMYEYQRGGGAYILRLGHSRRRTPDLIRGEVDWINFLADGGAGVARAIESLNGELVEVIPDEKDGTFLASAFVKAQGGPMWVMGGWTDGLMETYGKLLGRIHALSKKYTVGDEAWRRPNWEDDQYGLDLPLEPAVASKLHEVMDYLQALPRDRASYGMIHQDAHAGNFFVDEAGRITLFDFDDCVYGHFAYDLAMVLFYAITNREDATAFAANFWPKFMRGYEAENDLDPVWQKEIPHFMKLREIDLYALILRDYDSLAGDAWVESFLDGRRERIVAGVQYGGLRIADCGFGI